MSNGAKKHESEIIESRGVTEKASDQEDSLGTGGRPAHDGSKKGQKLNTEEPQRQEARRGHFGKASSSRWKGKRVDND